MCVGNAGCARPEDRIRSWSGDHPLVSLALSSGASSSIRDLCLRSTVFNVLIDVVEWVMAFQRCLICCPSPFCWRPGGPALSFCLCDVCSA